MNKIFYQGKKAKKAGKKKQNLQFEALENRVLLSADLGISAADLQQPDESVTGVIESELQLSVLENAEFEPESIAVDDSLTRLLGEGTALDMGGPATADPAAEPAPEAGGPDDVVPADGDAQDEGLVLSAGEVYLVERMMASQIVILDAGIPQLESVINELFSSADTQLAATLESLQSNPLTLVPAPVSSADQPATDMGAQLAGADLQQQLLLNADRDIKIFVLDAEREGVEQIGSVLDYFENVAAIHLLSHGSAGALFLGSSTLTTQQLKNSQQQLKRWGSALSSDGDLLLYGCDVAEGELGLEFVETLATLTGADVAASNDDTGNLPGADWDLENSTGVIETQSLSIAAMQGVLATTPTDGNDTLTNPTGTIKGLKGDDAYVFNTNSFGVVTVTELKNEGTDTLDLSALSVDLTFTIKKDNVVVVTYSSGGTANKITATQIENIKGGSGNDTFIVQKGAELKGTLDGGAGTNTLSYTDPAAGIFDKSYSGAVAVDFTVGSAADSARATAIAGFAVGKVTNIQQVIGGNGDDFLKGFSGADDLSGGKGADTLQGGAGIDLLKGDAGDDHLDGGADTDTLEGGAGKDTLVASTGGDTLKGGAGDDLYEFSDTADWNGTTVTELAGEGTDTLDFSAVGADLSFTVNDLALTGLAVSAGASSLSGALHIERIVAGSGINTFNFKNSWADKLVISATAGATVTADFSAVTTDLYFSIKADGTVVVADTSNRSGGHRVTLSHVDNLVGGQGVNTFSFAAGGSISGNLNGGSGTGILDYSQFDLTTVVDLSNVATAVPGVGGTLSNIDELVGSEKQDHLSAADSGQSLSGDRGDDFLFGGSGADVLAGDQGDDTLVGGAGNDSFSGGKGDDSYLFSGSWGQDTGITELANGGSDTISFAGMDLQAATAALPQIDAIAAVSADLTITFNADGSLNVTDDSATANTLAVAAASLPEIESLLGGSGANDYVFQDNWGNGSGTSILLDDTASSAGTLDFSAVSSDLKFVITDDNGVTVITVTTAVNGKVYSVTARGVENLIGGTGDNQYRFEGAAVLGGSLTGFSGTGVNAGTATLDFSAYDGGSGHGVKLDLTAATAKAIVDPADAAQDTALIAGTLSSINDLIGSGFDDELTGDAQVNRLDGGAGNDTLKGGAQNDTLIGGKGSDSLQGEGGDDTYKVESKWTSLDLSLSPNQTDTISDSDGANTLDLSDISKDLQVTFTDVAAGGSNVSVKVALNALLSNTIKIDNAGNGTDSWTLKTGSGDDTVIIKDKVDSTVSLEAGEGSNTLDYFTGGDKGISGYKSSVSVDLDAGTATGLAGISDFQHIYGSVNGGADQLTGDDGDNNFYVGIWGELDGSNARNHVIDGGDGSDTISFVNFDQADFDLVLDLSSSIVTHEDTASTVMTVATLAGIENLVGGAGNDRLIGDAAANVLNGGGGDDSLEGGDGDDTYAFDSDWGLDSIVENLVEGTDVLNFSGVTEALTFNNGRGDGTEVDLATALTRNVTVTDGSSVLTADFNVETFAGVKETDTLEQANVILTTAVQDEMISGLEALKAMAEGLSTGYSEFDALLDLQLPLVGETLSGLLVNDSGVAVNIADELALRIQAQINALKTLFWGASSATANDGNDSNTDALFALTDTGGEPLFFITENTRLLEFGSSLELFTRTQPLGIDFGGTLSEIPGVEVELNPDVTTTLKFDYAFGVLPTDPADPAADLAFHVSNPGLNFAVSLFDDAIYAGLDFGVIAASIGGPAIDDAKGLLALNIDLTIGAQGDLSEQILLDTVSNNSYDSLFSLQADRNTGVSASLPVVVDAAGLGLDIPSLPTITLNTPALPELPSLGDLGTLFGNLDWSLPDLSELFDLGSISLDQIFEMMRSGLNYLVNNFDFSLNIPGLNLSLDDIFKNLPGFDLGLEDFLSGLLEPLNNFDVSLGLQGLEDWLNAQLTDLLPDLWPDWSLPSFDFSYDGFDLGIDFDFDLNLGDLFGALGLPQLELGFDFDLADLAAFLNLPAGFDPAQLGITMAADGTLLVDADLDIALELDLALQEYALAVIGNAGPAGLNVQDYAFIGDDTQVSLAVRAGADDIDVEASLSISDSLPDIGFWIENGSAIVDAVAAITLPQVGNGRYQLSTFDISNFSFEAGGEASLDLPMFLGTGSLPMGGSELDLNGDSYADNVLHAGFDFDLSGLSTPEVIAPNFAGFSLIAFLNDPATVLEGMEGMFEGIKSLMVGELGRLGLPLVGDVLNQSGAFVDQLRDSLLGDKSSGTYVDGLGKELTDAAANGDDVISLIRDALFNALGAYLQVAKTDANGDPAYDELGKLIYGDVESADDIGLVLTAEGALTFNVLLAGSVFEGLADYVERMGDTDGDGIDDAIIKRFLEVPINFDLSAPGLGLKTGPTDTIEVSLDYFFGLGFGLDTSGFFLDTAGVTEAGEELGLTLDASLSEGASLLGTLGFLQMRMTEVDDDDGNSGLRGKIAMDLQATGDRWRIGEALTMSAQISAEANVDLFATLEMDFGDDIALPNAFTTVHYDQQLADITWESGSSFSADFLAPPEVVLEDVTLDVGDLFSGFIGPIALELDPFLGADSELRRVLDILTTDIDLGVDKINLLDIAVLAMNVKAAGTGDILRTTVTALLAVSDFITLAADAARNGTSIEVNFGTFALGSSLVTSDSTAISNDDLSQSGGQSATDAVANDPNATASQKNLVANLGTSPGSIMFPILYDPMTAVGLLLGKDVDLFIYDTPDIDFSILYEQSFPIFAGLNAVIKGELEVFSDFYFGFDTTGIRSWFNEFEANDYDFGASVSHLGDIFDGFFIADWAVSDTGQLIQGDDVPEVTLKVTFAAGAALGIGGLVEAGVLGGVEAEIGLNLHDLPKTGTGGNTGVEAVYDGKIRFEEVASILQENPLCLFDMEGTIKAFLEGYLWVGVKVFGSKITLFEASKRFVEVTLARFEWICPDLPDPTVATLNNGVLTLAYTDADGNTQANLPEIYKVYLDNIDVTPSDGIDNEVERIFVTGNGHTQVFDPTLVTSIRAAGTANNDEYEISTEIVANLEIHGAGGNDIITLTGNSNADKSRRIYGEGGNDTLIGTNMADLIVGGDGNDNIMAQDGADVIFGDNEDGTGTGSDFIWATGTALGTSGLANGFANYIDAGAGSDQVLTGEGNDRILGGTGDDFINAGGGIDTIDGGDDADHIIAGTGADIVVGGRGDDTLSWENGDGADSFDGGQGNDEIFMAGYSVNPDEFYKADTSNYIVDDGAVDTVVVSASGGDTRINWQHGASAGITLSGSGVEILSMDTGMGADDIVIGNLATTSVGSVKLSTGTQRSLVVENRFVKERNDAGDLVDTAQTLEFKMLQVADDNAIDRVQIDGTHSADNYLVSTVESTGVGGNTQTAMRYEQLDGGKDIAGNPSSHVIVDVYDLETNDYSRLSTLGGNDSIDALGVTQALVSHIYLDGGADDDRIIGTNLASVSDVIIGGSGSDRMTGGAGIDQFYEQSDSGADANIDGDVDVLVESRDADFILSDTRLVIDDSEPLRKVGDPQRLSGQFGNETETFTNLFENAELSGFDSANWFELTGWSGGGLLDGGKGGDSYTLELAQLASGRQYLNIADSGGAAGLDSLIYKGSAGKDTIQLDTVYKRAGDVEKRFTDDRWSSYGNYGDGLLIAHFDANDSFGKVDLDDEDSLMNVREASLSEGADYQVVNYHSVEQVTVFGGAEADKFISDSTESQIDVYGDAGDDLFYVGSVLKTDTVLVEGQEVTIVLEITDGANVNNSNFFGGEGDDYFEVNHNVADIGLYGDNGNDTFFIKALLTLDDDGELLDLDSGVSSVSGVSQDPTADTREVDVDTLVYVENANIIINGGAGFDSVALVGTVLSDTFYVFVERDPVTGDSIQRIYGAGVKLQKLLNIERLQLLTGGGDDTVYLYGVDMGLIGDMVIKTGSGSDLVQIGGPEQVINLNYPKNRDQFYAAVEGYEVDQDALGNYLSVDTVSGMPFYQIDETGRIVGFQVENPAVTLQVTMPESTDIDAFVSPVLIDGGEGANDRVIVNNQSGNNRIRFANVELERKDVVFDYTHFTLTSTATDFVDTVLGNASTGAIAQDLLASAAGDYLRFQDRYYDTELLNNIANGSQTELTIPAGLSYFNIQNTLKADGTISYARAELELFAADFDLDLDYAEVEHPDPSRAGEYLYQLNGISKNDVAVAFEAQHKETVVYDLGGNRIVYQDLTALTLKTTAPLRVQFGAGAITSIESVRSDAMDTLHGVDAAAALHFTGMDEVTLNLTDETGGVQGSELHIDNSLFTGRLQVQGGIHTDRIFVEQTQAVTTVHGNAGNDEIIVGKNGMLDQLGQSIYLFGDEGTDSIEVDRAGDASAADVSVDQNLLEHSTGFEQLSRITSAISLQGITDEENDLLEAELKSASEAYADAAFAVSQGDLDTALDEISEASLEQLLDVLNSSKEKLATSVTEAADTLRLNDQQLLENQIKLYTRARYYESNAIDDALLDRMSALGLKAKFSVTYSYEIFGITFDNLVAHSAVTGLQSGFNTAEDWLRNFGSRVNITDDDGNAQDITVDASGNRSALQQLLENASGQSDIYDLINGALNQNRQTVFTATEDNDGWLDVTFKLELVSTSVHQANDNNVRALAQLYDTLVNDYLGSQDIYADLLKARSYNGSDITQADLNSFYNSYQSNADIRGFNINDPLAGGKALSSELIASVDAVNLDLSASVLAKQSATVIAQLQQFDLTRSNSFADIYDDKLDALIAQIGAALGSDDYSQATLASISADLATLLAQFNPYDDDNGFAADRQMVLAPVYNALAANTSNGLIDVLDGINQLHTDLDGADFVAILNSAAAAAGYDDFETLFNSAGYTQVREAYATASELIDSFLIYSAGQPDMEDLPIAVTDVLRGIKVLDRAAERFEAFVNALESGFDFATFRTSYLANQAAVQQFVANNPQYIAYLQSEARYEAMTSSLTRDANDVVTLAALNEQQYQLLVAARDAAVTQFASLKTSLYTQYTFTFDYWWFTRTVHLDYTVDFRYVQQQALVANLQSQVALAKSYFDGSESQTDELLALRQAYSDQEESFENLIETLGSTYEAQKKALNAQFLVLKEISGLAVEIIKARGPDQDIAGFADDSSLISEIISFNDEYRILDEDAAQDPLDLTKFVSVSADGSREATKNSVIFQTEQRDYTAVTTVAGMTNADVFIHVGYDDVENLTLNLGEGADSVQVLDTLGQATAEVFVNTAGGDDEITVSDENTTTEGIVSHLIVDAGTGSNKLDINDINDATADSIIMTNTERAGYTSVTGIASGNIHYRGAYGQGVLLQAGKDGDDIHIDGVIAGAATLIRAGEGDDDITVTDTTSRVDDSTSLTILGELGDDVIDASKAGFQVTIEGNEGDDVIFGSEHDDTLSGNEDNDLILGGLGADTISGNAGHDLILGDLGSVTLQVTGIGPVTVDYATVDATDLSGKEYQYQYLRDGSITALLSTLTGGNAGNGDTITGGSGIDALMGGAGMDVITDDDGNSLVVGDHALISYLAGMTLAVSSRFASEGEQDQITLNGTNNYVIGGSGGDEITTSTGTGFVLGDHGTMSFSGAQLISIHSSDESIGGADIIDLGDGDKTVIGGVGNDTVNAGTGTHRVIGDNGAIDYDAAEAGALRSMQSTSDSNGGVDTITLLGSLNQVIGGSDGDFITVNTASSTDQVLGDNGSMTFTGAAGDELLSNMQSPLTQTGGGNDEITLGAGNKVVIAGIGADTVTTPLLSLGTRYVIGDEGEFDFDANNILQTAKSTSTRGDGDTLTLGGASSADVNLVIGGVGGDDIDTGDSTDYILGDNGVTQWTAGIIDSMTSTDQAFGGNDDINTQGSIDIVFGGQGADTITLGMGNDIGIGDNGAYDFQTASISSIDGANANGGSDTIKGNEGDDILFGGVGGDIIDGNSGRDLIFGDQAMLTSRAGGDNSNPRLRALTDGLLYGSDASAQIGATHFSGPAADIPAWSNWSISVGDGLDGLFGNDYIAGGAENDTIFGQRGKDTIQGDGSIDTRLSDGTGVSASRTAAGDLVVVASVEASADGDDYIEGGGENDVIFGNLGQDDIIGGNSSLFGLALKNQRADGADLIFGGAGTDISRNNMGDTDSRGHARDADMILGDNGNIYRIVGTEGVANAGQYLNFSYDNYNSGSGTLNKIVVRAAQLLDYTEGGPDLDAAALAGDHGAGDEIHGESGDDFVYGMTGNDVLFGDAQDDDIIGGWGHDWISGGTGDDGVLGDDGRIHSSRNGLTETLNGLTTAVTQQNIATSGKAQEATINVAGKLKKTVNLTPFNVDPATVQDVHFAAQYADDIIFGGLGNDALHGGAGDDAMSGAEAMATPAYGQISDAEGNPTAGLVRIDFERPFNPGNVLHYNPYDVTSIRYDASRPAGEFALYDEYDPQRKILLTDMGGLSKTGSGKEFFLNFNPAEVDGDDVLFGDLGNDWMVGGSGNDNLYGGYGDDLLNVDDNLNTNGGLNNAPDADYADLAFGGAGRDIMIGNAEADRLIDWAGEFNTYLVPFNPFGLGTVSRQLQPSVADFLYALSASDGADQTRAADSGSDPARHGEPDGELGLVTQKDAYWGDQTGGPADPQSDTKTSGTKVKTKGAKANNNLLASSEAPRGMYSDDQLSVTPEAVAQVLAQAKHRWALSGLVDAASLGRLDDLRVEIVSLDGAVLAQVEGNTIYIDSNAAGWGWFVDATAAADEEYRTMADGSLQARAGTEAYARMDLLTVLSHEIGHVLGYVHSNSGRGASLLMDTTLAAGVRELPESGAEPALAPSTIAGLTGWKMATGERSGTVKLAQRGFDSLRHEQRHVMHWDEAKQCFAGDDKIKKAAPLDWEKAAGNIRTH
uniref:DUF4347 domain-containing protein n=1 Tax=Marinobacterium profundum TaxID=1714300 RepID=UPI000832B14A|nr:DUF4347 domain-containing protein [Marinobacterium profundum]